MEPQSIDRIFWDAAQLAAPDECAAYLDRACGDDGELRRKVEQLLRARPKAENFLEAPAVQLVAGAALRPLCEGPGTVIGPYKLLEQIGEGGFGLVFMAEQQQPVRRKVAVKVIKPGMDTRQVIARFEAERQALALMDHPNIARVLDVGETATGRPYFAMELVRGVPITEHSDQNSLTLRQRLELFLTVCQAVQHAHQKGIIHRDLKPSNVLVTLHDGEAIVKVIDFGVAKALGRQLTDKTLYTGFAQLVGTPLYMSPEQAEMSGLDVDTRSDVYSLGVLLYELLTGTTPFDKERLGKAAYEEMLRIIREEKPAKPSTRLSTLGEAATLVSERRQSDPKRLSALVHGELDWIVMKALEKERGRRYGTASAFAAVIERYLHDQPVSACPPSRWYRFGKFARRHKLALFTTALVTLALVSGTALSLWQAIRAAAAVKSEARALRDLGAEEQATRRALERSLGAEEQATRELFDALVAQARANRLSRRIGQRFGTLELLRKAATIARQLKLPPERFLEMRNEAIAALALPDLRVAKEWPDTAELGVGFDATLERYGRTDRQGNVQVRRAGDGKEIYRLAEIGPGYSSPALSPDGGYLTVFDEGRGRVYVWKLKGADPPRVLNVPAVGNACFSPDSRQLALQEPNGAISVFDLATSTTVRRLPKLPQVSCLAFHPGGRRLAVACDTFAQALDLETGKVLWQKDLAANSFRCAQWDPAGKVLAVVDGDGISLWDVAHDKQTGRLEGIRGRGIAFRYNPAGTLVVSNGWAGILSLWDPLTDRQVFSTHARLHTQATAAQFSTGGRFLAATQHGGKLRIWEIAAANEYRTLAASPLKGKRAYRSVDISLDGRLLAAGADGAFALWDLPTGKELAFLEGSPFNGVAFEHRPPATVGAQAPEEMLLTMQVNGLCRRPIRALPGSGAVHIGAAQRLPIPAANAGFAQSRDGRVLACAQFQGALVLHADQPDKPIKLEAHDDVRNVAVSPDGRWVATGRWSYPGGVKIWERTRNGGPPTKGLTYKLVRELPSGDGTLPVFSPDGKRLLISESAAIRPIHRWEVGTWVEAPFQESIEGLTAAFSPDGKLVVVETGSGVARLIDAGTGREYAQLEDPTQDRTDRWAFTSDATKLACAGEGCCVHVWDLRAIRRQLAEMGLDWESPP
ncbi:MAG: protein kinase domain-containing protein [Isosphaeraceae bacterium]